MSKTKSGSAVLRARVVNLGSALLVATLLVVGCESFSNCSDSRTCEVEADSDADGLGGEGGQLGSGGKNDPGKAPEAPVATLSFAIKEFRFSWNETAGATFYQLARNVGGEWRVEKDELKGTSLTLDVALHLFDWSNALYRIEACNDVGCSNSNELDVSDAGVEAVGYFKTPDHFDRADSFWAGRSVALSANGTYLAVGRPGGPCANASPSYNAKGAIDFYSKDEAGWTYDTCVMIDDDAYAAGFGGVMALDGAGENLIVGVKGDTRIAPYKAGAAYLYAREDGTWVFKQRLVDQASSQKDFGAAVAMSADGSTFAVAAPASLNGGVVIIYDRETLFSDTVSYESAVVDEGDAFGASVALSKDGSRLAVGSPFEDSSATGIDGVSSNEASTNSGAAYVFVKVNDFWSQESYVKASNTRANSNFGTSVSISEDGDTLAVGSAAESSNATGVGGNELDDSAAGAGAVYVFARTAEVWSQQAYLKASNSTAGISFGVVALSGSGDILAVGAPGETSLGSGVNADPEASTAAKVGAAYLFTRKSSAWTETSIVKAVGPAEGDEFGSSVALSRNGESLVIGAPNEKSVALGIGGDPTDDQADFDYGAVFLY